MEEQDKTEKSKADKPSEEDTEAGKAAAEMKQWVK